MTELFDEEAAEAAMMAEMHEADAIAGMLKAAAEYGLQVEVVMFYARFIKEGDAPEVAAARAMYEWDL